MENLLEWLLAVGFWGRLGIIFGALFLLLVLWILWVQLSDHFSSESETDEEPDFGDEDD